MLAVQDISERAKNRLNDLHVKYQKLVKIYSVDISPEMVEEVRQNGKFTVWGQEFIVFRAILMLPGEVITARRSRIVQHVYTAATELENFKRQGWMHPAKAEMLQDALQAVIRRIEEE